MLTSSLREAESGAWRPFSAELEEVSRLPTMKELFKRKHICIASMKLTGKYSDEGGFKTKFGVSTQSTTVCDSAFVDGKEIDMNEYDFAIRERPRHKR